MINKDDAVNIKKKLHHKGPPVGISIGEKTKKRHDVVELYYHDMLIADYGISRDPNRDKGHDHIPDELFITPHQCKNLSRCPLSVDAYVEILKGKGIIPR